MKKAVCFSYIALLILMLSACNGKKEKNFLFNLDNIITSENLKLSQLTDNIRCIPLETNENFVLPDNTTRYWVSDKYIITLSDKDIRQFSPEGKFVRKLASSGKGPDEYLNIFSYTVDEERDILYFGHQGDWNHIFAIDLKDGKSIGKIETRCLPRYMTTSQGNILCFPFNYQNEANSDAILVHPEGKILESIPTSSSPEGFDITPNLTLIPSNENDLFISRNDSLFQFTFKGFIPLLALQYSDKFDPATHSEGVQWDILFKNKDFVLVQKINIEMKQSEEAIRINMTSNASELIDLQNSTHIRIKGFYIDPLEEEYKNFPSFKLTGKKLVWKMSAFDLKELAQNKREKGETLSPVLQQLDEQLTEESNPVLIIGDLK